VLDGSLSIGQENFDTKMTEYVINTFCGFRDTRNNATYEAGAIIFNQYITTAIPFREFTPNQFETAVNRNVKGKKLRCCTTHAEAAILAKEMFDKAGSNDDYENIAFFVTDGQPFINFEQGPYGISKSGKDWYTRRGFDYKEWSQGNNLAERGEERARYAAQVVPKYLQELRDADVRVFFIGVPHKNPDKNVRIEYFKGEDDEICFVNNDVPGDPITNCESIDPNLKQLVSYPPDDHAFAVQEWTMKPLVDESLEQICKEWTPPSVDCSNKTRDVLILVDTSESMDPERYQVEMMEVVKAAAMELDFESGSRVGVITFGHRDNTRIRIPLRTFDNIGDFNVSVDANVKTVELKCCTNLAEAMILARNHFQNHYKEGHDKIMLIITDGTPYQNYGRKKWEWREGGVGEEGVLNRCEYVTQVVPEQAALVQGDGVRIVLAGVLNVDGRAPMESFFTGSLAGAKCCVNPSTNKACLVNNEREWCSMHYKPTEPKSCHTYTNARVVSEGSRNIFTASSWELGAMTAGIKSMICSGAAWKTPPPTPNPTARGQSRPTRKPTPDAGNDDAGESLDLIIMLDNSALDDAQGTTCTSAGETCSQHLYDFANNTRHMLRKQLKRKLWVTAHHASCSRMGPLYQKPLWSNRFTVQDAMMKRIKKKPWFGAKCITGMLDKVRNIIESRKVQSRKYAVLILTHGGNAIDTCAAASLTSAIPTGSTGKIYVGTVGTNSAHNTMCQTIGASGSVSNALSSNSYESVVSAILADLDTEG